MIVALLFILPAIADGLQVHVITRHGARSPLIKNPDDLRESGGELTPMGYAQHVALGEWLRQKYPLDSTFARQEWESSPTQRTLVSAQGLAAGFLSSQPSYLPPPIYSTRSVNDVDIRAYDKCPVFHERLQKLYESSKEWSLLEKSEESLLKILASSFPQYAADGETIPLSEVWNVFDQIDVAHVACTTSDCQPQEIASLLTADQWERLTALSHQAEVIKYSTTAGNLVGSNLVARILRSMQNTDESSLHVYSGHYPTLLGVLATLQVQLPDTDVIPPLASALILQLNDDNGRVTIDYKAGNVNSSTTLLSIPLETLDQRLRATPSFLDSPEAWCDACRNDTADVCLRIRRRPSTLLATSFTAVIFVALFAWVLWRRKRRAKKVVDATEFPEAELT